MKNSIKQTTMFIFGLLLTGTMFSCQEDATTKDVVLDDIQLIEAIQKSVEKIEITSNELPTSSVSVLDEDYYDSYTDETLLAPELGYEVAMRKGKGSLAGELAQVYFNMQGRKLASDNAYGDKEGYGGKEGYKNKERHDCFELVLPVSFTMPDATIITIDNEEDWEGIKEWFEANPESKERPVLQFPVNIVFKDETTVTVNSEEEMKVIHEYCGGSDKEHHKGRCFDFVYPITKIMPDGTEIIKEDRKDRDAIKAWYEANPDSNEKPTLKFPVDVVFVNGKTFTVNNEEEMKAIREGCGEVEKEHHKKRCFDFVYPITKIMPDGTEIIKEDRADRDAIKAWYETNTESEEKPTLKFPLDVIFKDGTTVTVNSIEEMMAIRKRCGEGHNDSMDKYTKNIVNPIVYIDDCDYPVSGTIVYLLDEEVVAVIDYGDGTCDNIATKTVDGETYEFELKKRRKGNGRKN